MGENIFAYSVKWFYSDEGECISDVGVIYGKDYSDAVNNLCRTYDNIQEIHIFPTECEGGYMTEEVAIEAMKWARNALSSND